MNKFIMTLDPGTANTLMKSGFKLAGQNGKQWFFVNDESLNKKCFAGLKYTMTNKLLFTDGSYAMQYLKN